MEETNKENDDLHEEQHENINENDDDYYAPFDPTAFLKNRNTESPNDSNETETNNDQQNNIPRAHIRLRTPPPEIEEENQKEEDQTNEQVKENQTEEIPEPPKQEPKKESEDTMSEEDKWKCPICLETLQQPVVTHCGHVFCYPCISEWLRRSNSCPVCHGQIDASQLIPIYGQGSEADVSSPPPPRPEYQEARNDYAFNRFTPFQYTVNITMNNVRNFFHMTPQKALFLVSLVFLVLTFYV
ncbi:putative E3 ubiquitin-protein ligase RNF5 [Histomonas meleagridis]|uniref:putative E3 ubiquitin-protein ligase RNF5 n=1 Tax=Histomonas meleagridis TaxID=135588 RepID=UPI0035594CE3|nr:putative E3 ubiquitin-protein ligase RNF5 [Histomonas meleagridis]KAH0796290.1 putative E3 ubiquitin-protein ligase RNF5 [Histomonas meleagridis]